MIKGYRDEIAGRIAEMPAINHHEHAWEAFSAVHGPEYDLPRFLCAGYLSGGLVASGFEPAEDIFDYLKDPALPDGAERVWAELWPHLQNVRSTSYFRYLFRCLKALFGITEEDVFSDHWKEHSEAIREYSRRHKGKGGELCERMKVRATVLDGKLDPNEWRSLDPGDHLLLHVVRLDMFIHEERGLAQTLTDVGADDFEAWLAAFDGAFRKALDAGASGFKTALAYNRRIEFADSSVDEAARAFRAGVLTVTESEKTKYQDFLINRLAGLCIEADVPLQIHSGIQAGTGHVLEDTRPTLLTSFFTRHPDLRVDLFHGGYPWSVQAGLMAKYFPNVYIDGCWLPQISPSAYRRALTSWIETVPANKIFAWGGDHIILEPAVASLSLAKDLIADVLADLVERDYFDLELASAIAERVLHKNGCDFWLSADR